MGVLALLVALIGGTFGPRTQGESLERIQEKRDLPRRPRQAPGAQSPATH